MRQVAIANKATTAAAAAAAATKQFIAVFANVELRVLSIINSDSKSMPRLF